MNLASATTEKPEIKENACKIRTIAARLLKYLGVLEDISAVLILLFIVSLISLAIVMRTTIQFESSAWEEISRFLSLWMYLLGVTIASRENSHLKMSFLEDKIRSQKAKKNHEHDILYNITWVHLCVCMVVTGVSAMVNHGPAKISGFNDRDVGYPFIISGGQCPGCIPYAFALY